MLRPPHPLPGVSLCAPQQKKISVFVAAIHYILWYDDRGPQHTDIDTRTGHLAETAHPPVKKSKTSPSCELSAR
jgi:hypothetical protein